MSELITKDAVVDIFRSGIPDTEWLLGQIESEHGWFRFPPYFSNLITNLKLGIIDMHVLNGPSDGVHQ